MRKNNKYLAAAVSVCLILSGAGMVYGQAAEEGGVRLEDEALPGEDRYRQPVGGA